MTKYPYLRTYTTPHRLGGSFPEFVHYVKRFGMVLGYKQIRIRPICVFLGTEYIAHVHTVPGGLICFNRHVAKKLLIDAELIAAHEVAHLKVIGHGPEHDEVIETLMGCKIITAPGGYSYRDYGEYVTPGTYRPVVEISI